jgi:hypothetical protein
MWKSWKSGGRIQKPEVHFDNVQLFWDKVNFQRMVKPLRESGWGIYIRFSVSRSHPLEAGVAQEF